MTNYQPLSILVLEPNPDHHLLIGYSCKVNNYQVNPIFATSPPLAWQHLEEYRVGEAQSPKLILLDILLPEPDIGLQFLRKVKERYPRLPVIILSNYQDEQFIQQAYDLGANSFITKPKTLDGWEGQFKTVLAYWLDVVTLSPS